MGLPIVIVEVNVAAFLRISALQGIAKNGPVFCRLF